MRPPALLAALLLALPASAEDVVRLGNLKFAHYGNVSFMKEVCPRFGVRVEERVFPKGIDIVPGILAGEIDLAASALDAALAGRAAGAPLLVVAGFAKGGVRLVARQGSGIARVQDLKGRKVGTARGGAQELLLYAELDKAGLTWGPGKDVQISFLAYADLNSALEAGHIDAMSQSEPQSAQAIKRGFGVELSRPYGTPLGEPVRALVMTEKLYANRDLAQRVLRCFVASTKELLAAPPKAEDWVRQKMFKGQLSHEDYLDAMSNASLTTDITLKHAQTTADLMLRYGVGKLQAALKASDFVRLDLLEEAKK